MMGKTSEIEWTDATWNVIGGCTEVSEGCDHCYARRGAYRMQFNPKAPKRYEGTVRRYQGKYLWTHRINLDWEALEDPAPLRWTKPRRIFVCSMSDLFHPKVDDLFIHDVWKIMMKAKRHTFMVLTKRPNRMRRWIYQASMRPLSNVWLGVTAENQQRADERIPILLDTPAAVRFVSIEPMLGPVDLFDVDGEISVRMSELNPRELRYPADALDWVIVGGESGREARPMHPDWARTVRDQCTEVGIPFFFKQWGEWAPADTVGRGLQKFVSPRGERGDFGAPGDYAMTRVGKRVAGRELDDRTWDEFPA